MDVVIIVSVSIMPLINISTIAHFINDVEEEERAGRCPNDSNVTINCLACHNICQRVYLRHDFIWCLFKRDLLSWVSGTLPLLPQLKWTDRRTFSSDRPWWMTDDRVYQSSSSSYLCLWSHSNNFLKLRDELSCIIWSGWSHRGSTTWPVAPYICTDDQYHQVLVLTSDNVA